MHGSNAGTTQDGADHNVIAEGKRDNAGAIISEAVWCVIPNDCSELTADLFGDVVRVLDGTGKFA